ncbi:MAG: EF-hand domain-containing protein [Sphingobium sp.]|nr:EF-hand domain-containing protein [Sphingobium sp.]
MKAFLIGSAAIAAAALAPMSDVAIAAPAPPAQPRPPMQDMKRTDVEAKLKERFAQIDKDMDGVITQAEISAHRTALRTQRQDERFKKLDGNGDGSVSRAEFDAAHARPDRNGTDRPMTRPAPPLAAQPVQPGEHAKEGRGMKAHHFKGRGHDRNHGMRGGYDFARADTNKDGKITWAEASATALSHFDKVDANKDGIATVAEQQASHKAMREQWKARANKADAQKSAPKPQ